MDHPASTVLCCNAAANCLPTQFAAHKQSTLVDQGWWAVRFDPDQTGLACHIGCIMIDGLRQHILAASCL
jgi:hypothetical protein